MSAHALAKAAPVPWYRQPWLWFVASWPIAAILAGSVTMYIAFSGADGLVADDYYKRGLAINRELTRDRNAASAQLAAQGSYDADRERLTIRLTAQAPMQWPPALTLRLIHPTQAQGDRQITLAAIGNGEYVGTLALPSGPKRRLIVEADTWRLSGEWAVGGAQRFALRSGPVP